MSALSKADICGDARDFRFGLIPDINQVSHNEEKETAFMAVSPSRAHGQAAAELVPAFRKAKRSELIVSACVVIMPCGKPL